MHHIKVIKDGNVNNVVKEQLVDGVQYVDNEPHEGSLNGITSDAVAKVAEHVTTAEGNIDSIEEKIPSGASSSNKLVTESDMEDALSTIGTGYTPKGNATVATLEALTGQSNGDMYIVTDSGTLNDGALAVSAGDSVAWDSTNEVWYKTNQYATQQEHDALTTYAQNVAHSIAPEFDPTRTSDNPYNIGDAVVHGGRLYKFNAPHYGAWSASDVVAFACSETFDFDNKLKPSAIYRRVADLHYENTTFSDGTGVAYNTGRISSGLIPVNEGDILVCDNVNRWYLVNLVASDKVTRVSNSSETRVVVPSGVAYAFILYYHASFPTIGKGLDCVVKIIPSVNKISAEDLGVTWGEEIDSFSVTVPRSFWATKITTVQDLVKGNCNASGEFVDATDRVRTDYINIKQCKTFTPNKSFWVRCFDENKEFIGTFASFSDSPFNAEAVEDMYSDCMYIVIALSADTVASVVISVSIFSGVLPTYKPSVGYKTRTGTVENLIVHFDGDKYTTARLMLPSNYSVTGKPVPLIVFCQGSSDYNTLNGSITTHYQTQYQYLCDEGFAILSVYGWGNFFQTEGVGTWNSPTNRKCWYGGIRYALSNYNLDSENIFVSAKSMGGAQALAIWMDGMVKVRAAGLLCPALNALAHRWGYIDLTRHNYAEDCGFSEDTNGVLDTDSFASLDNFILYATENYPKWIGYEPYLKGLINLSKTDKINYLGRNDVNYFDVDTMYRVGNRGSKFMIWSPEDDTTLHKWSRGLINSLQNGNCPAELRVMPSGGVDPHHIVDTDPNAPQATDITTRLGVHYETIALAYYEMAQFFIREQI